MVEWVTLGSLNNLEWVDLDSGSEWVSIEDPTFISIVIEAESRVCLLLAKPEEKLLTVVDNVNSIEAQPQGIIEAESNYNLIVVRNRP